MGFGDFAMGYLVGQSFSGPNHIPDGNTPYSEWSSQAKKDFQKICDEAYWREWDRAFKEKVIERLSSGERIHASIYPDIVSKRWVELITSGEIKLIANINTPDTLRYIWTNMDCEYAQRDGYKEFYKKDVEPCLNNSSFRIVS
ncbi:hypothetical protein T36_0608 [Helicobacter cinaedi]|uniref:hypothetical protein n=1 Tax=Helicobacter cinaedi TaxID=213 RepID=UPI001F19270A|nr:hypothetical protein [Helicobacter cinaedi]BDB64161.1 hypothetical protein T36_0608 [Helicobacter cinaedi]